MRIFVSNLTVYTYDNPYREALNMEEVDKFTLGLDYAQGDGKVDEIYVFSDYSLDEFREKVDGLEGDERDNFRRMVLDHLDYLRRRGVRVNFKKADLTDFKDTYRVVLGNMRRVIESGEKAIIYVNLSCGHKIGALATYIAMTHLRDECRNRRRDECAKKPCEDIVVVPYHAEREVVHFPALNIVPEYASEKYEGYLHIFSSPITYDEAKRAMMGEMDEREAERAILYLLKKRRLIKRRGDRYSLTERGRTLLYLLRTLDSVSGE